MIQIKKNLPTLLLTIAASATIFFSGCKKDKETESEVITKVAVHLTGIGTSFDQEFEAIDSDGDGVFNSIDTIKLPQNATFNCRMHVYDETKNPVLDITDEIEAESADHLFVFKASGLGLVISNLNWDSNGNPFGLESIWATGFMASGPVEISLIHEPTDKTAADPGGDVDFQVIFPVVVE
jgi:hypothetical protein